VGLRPTDARILEARARTIEKILLIAGRSVGQNFVHIPFRRGIVIAPSLRRMVLLST
jgi:hypothetical protein